MAWVSCTNLLSSFRATLASVKGAPVWAPRLLSPYSTFVKSGMKNVNGVHLHYQQTGSGSHAVLLLPGALGSSHTDFGPQLDYLNKEYFTVVAWDPRGYGKSIPPERDFPLDFFSRDAGDAVALMKALSFNKFSMLGWSDGGITALTAAAVYPSVMNKLVVWGANAYVTQEDLQLYNAVRDVSTWSEKMRKPMEKIYGPEYFAKTWLKWVEGISQFALQPDGNICREMLPQIVCPTLIIHGQKDPMVPNFHPEFLHKHIKNSRLHLMPEGKHNLHLRFSKDFNKLVEEFLLER
uniref:Biphenyl hydrolase like n=1 Tax=Erpetoichthys calabaricus TaxID=27687 RepID=A0A8C4RFF7_ERPCA